MRSQDGSCFESRPSHPAICSMFEPSNVGFEHCLSIPRSSNARQSLRLIGASVAEACGDAIGGGHEVGSERVDELL
jgi:hypothetical protein